MTKKISFILLTIIVLLINETLFHAYYNIRRTTTYNNIRNAQNFE